MRFRICLLLAALLMPSAVQAQWRAGTYLGASFNMFSMDLQYMTDYKLDGLPGAAMGVTGQYDLSDWLALRADLNLVQKNYRQHRVALSSVDYWYRNTYLQLPVMASFSFGGRQLRGFCNLGVYGGVWLDSRREGTDYNYFSRAVSPHISFNERLPFNQERDCRWDFGFLGGLGAEYRFVWNWAARAEVNCYYSVVSTTKQYMRVKDYRYNTTAALQLGAVYSF